MKKPLKTQLSLLQEGHPVHIAYLEEQIKNFVKLDLGKYMELNGTTNLSAFKDICDAIGKPDVPRFDGTLTVGSAAKDLWSLVVDEDIPDEVYEDKMDIYGGVFTLTCPFSWRRKEHRRIYHIKD